MKAVFGLLLTACCNYGMKEPVLDMQSEENYCFQRLILTVYKTFATEGIWHYLTCTCKRFTQPREDANRKNLLDEEADFNMRENKLNGC
ncbi:hypothetical protein T4E_2743 [Trichinella pseudospiralis]|uniref:Uncharacterized protein n=1 Tax=Trichinella pseudospiralis TaxID=6337 RepID=A0A0V0Y5Q4_TRIPS|nr:hypothetical protein T4E_2743 [Trichinella pseudospiralis]